MDKRTYRWLYDHVQCRYYDLLLRWCFLPLGGEPAARRSLLAGVVTAPGDRVLDLCCGTGGATRFLREQLGPAGWLTGVDLSLGQVRIARRKAPLASVPFAVMDAARTGFADGTFGAVVIPHAIHEMARPERHAVLREARRILADAGRLAVLETAVPGGLVRRLILGFFWFAWLPFNPETPTRRDLLARGVDTEVREAGFRAVARTTVCRGALQLVQGRR